MVVGPLSSVFKAASTSGGIWSMMAINGSEEDNNVKVLDTAQSVFHESQGPFLYFMVERFLKSPVRKPTRRAQRLV